MKITEERIRQLIRESFGDDMFSSALDNALIRDVPSMLASVNINSASKALAMMMIAGTADHLHQGPNSMIDTGDRVRLEFLPSSSIPRLVMDLLKQNKNLNLSADKQTAMGHLVKYMNDVTGDKILILAGDESIDITVVRG